MPGIGAGVFAVVAVAAAAPAYAQSPIPASTPMSDLISDDPTARMLLEADELIYDLDNDMVSAAGSVEIYYRDYTVEADRVDYDQKTGQVFARGNVKVIAPDKNVIYADTVELTEEFRDGFVQELTLVTTDETRFAASSAERFDENVTVFNKGVYTACKPCQEQPEKAPFWQIKAKKIIHDQKEQTVYYEDASFEFFGMPIAYMPYFSHPDPTVKQRSGFLRPDFVYDSELGYGVEIPYYFALAPDYDLTVSVTPYTIQGPLGAFEWRQRFEKGSLNVRGAGIYQLDPDEFEPIREDPYIASIDNEKEFRGVLQSEGLFEINEFWKWGWKGTLLTDPTFMRTYDLTSEKETRDELFLTGQSARNYFDARVMHYQVFSDPYRFDNDTQPIIHPIVDHNYIFGESIMGGRLSLDTNFLSLTRDAAEFMPTSVDDSNNCPTSYLNNLHRINDLDDPATINRLVNNLLTADRTNPENCELLATPGTSTRLVTEARWERTLTGPYGQVFKPFMSLRGDAYAIDVTDPYVSNGYVTSGIIDRFTQTGDDQILRGMASAGLEYRYPILVSDDWGYQIFEPIAQVIARPDAQYNDVVPNNDALSLVFDDTTLFQTDKFSGWDQMEGGTRANVGMRYSAQAQNGVRVSGLFGQSYQLAGENPFPNGSGLETDRSDYVASLYFSPTSSFQIANRIRLDEDDFESRRYDLEMSGGLGPLYSSVIYSQIAADPEQGIDDDREEIQGLAKVRFDENWSVWAGGRYELSGSTSSSSTSDSSSQWISNTFGFGYENECVTFAISYQRLYDRNDIDVEPDERITFRFSLRTLTEGKYTQSIGGDDE